MLLWNDNVQVPQHDWVRLPHKGNDIPGKKWGCRVLTLSTGETVLHFPTMEAAITFYLSRKNTVDNPEWA